MIYGLQLGKKTELNQTKINYCLEGFNKRNPIQNGMNSICIDIKIYNTT
jgi:hypothetical protein